MGDHVAMKRSAGYAKISDVSIRSSPLPLSSPASPALPPLISPVVVEVIKIYFKGHPDSKLSEGYCSLEVYFYLFSPSLLPLSCSPPPLLCVLLANGFGIGCSLQAPSKTRITNLQNKTKSRRQSSRRVREDYIIACSW